MLHGMTRIQLNSVLSIVSVATTTSSALTRRWGKRFRRSGVEHSLVHSQDARGAEAVTLV